MLHFKTKEEANYFIITLEGDLNDGDCVSRITKIPKHSFNEFVLEEVRNAQSVIGKYLPEDMYFEAIDIPFDGNSHCHTIVDIKVEFVDDNGVIYDVEVE